MVQDRQEGEIKDPSAQEDFVAPDANPKEESGIDERPPEAPKRPEGPIEITDLPMEPGVQDTDPGEVRLPTTRLNEDLEREIEAQYQAQLAAKGELNPGA